MSRDSSQNRVRLPTKILHELGLLSLWKSSLDVKLLCAQRFVRLFAYGGSTLILASYLSSLNISDAQIGLFMTLTLVGDVVISFFLTLFADAMGRKAVLLLGSALMVGSGVIFAVFDNFWILLAAAVLGVISPSGNEIGPFRAVEESTLAHLTPHESLSDIFAWYSLIGTAGTALGMMACGWAINLLQVKRGWQFVAACQVIFFAYAAIGALKCILAAALSHHVEAEKQKPAERQDQQGENGETQPLLGERTRGEQPPKKTSFFSFLGDRDLVALVVRLFILFALDSFASGLATLSWMTYFFKRKFSLPEALTFLVLRACTQNMDVAPRSAFLAAALPSDKRTAIMGAVNVVKTGSQSLGPLITGVLSNHGLFGLSFTLAGILKAVYDIGMLLSFAGTEPVRRPRSAPDSESA
ncbi:hypothetical protein APSETT445_005531 [Aspergillus pseudonomiae]